MSDKPQLTKRGHLHLEAFCLMAYACEHCHHSELIWNSRDGVTPFGTQCPSCGQTSLYHVEFHKDHYAPNYELKPYQKFWRDGTPDEAEAIMRARVAQHRDARPDLTDEYIENMIQKARDGTGDSGFAKGWPRLDVYIPGGKHE